jgi:hypothetical protein
MIKKIRLSLALYGSYFYLTRQGPPSSGGPYKIKLLCIITYY